MNNEMDLFKQAIREALDKKIDEAIKSENEEINVSKKHKIAMRTILRGKIPTEGRVSPKTVRIIAIVAIIALLLASCAIIYREEIGKLRVKILERYDLITSSDKETYAAIEEIYELTYIPDGYELKNSSVLPRTVVYEYNDADGNRLILNQNVIDKNLYHIDNENGEREIITVNNFSIYYRQSSEQHIFLWNNEKYVFLLCSDINFSTDELTKIIEGVKII